MSEPLRLIRPCPVDDFEIAPRTGFFGSRRTAARGSCACERHHACVGERVLRHRRAHNFSSACEFYDTARSDARCTSEHLAPRPVPRALARLNHGSRGGSSSAARSSCRSRGLRPCLRRERADPIAFHACEGPADRPERTLDRPFARLQESLRGPVPARDLRNLSCVGERRDPGVVDLDAGDRELLTQRRGQELRDTGNVTPEAHLAGRERLVRATIGDPRSAISLRIRVALEAVDVEDRVRRIVDAPRDDRRDPDRIAAQVVDRQGRVAKLQTRSDTSHLVQTGLAKQNQSLRTPPAYSLFGRFVRPLGMVQVGSWVLPAAIGITPARRAS